MLRMHRIGFRKLKNVLQKYRKIVEKLQSHVVPKWLRQQMHRQQKNVILPNARKWAVILQNAKKVASRQNAKLIVNKLQQK